MFPSKGAGDDAIAICRPRAFQNVREIRQVQFRRVAFALKRDSFRKKGFDLARGIVGVEVGLGLAHQRGIAGCDGFLDHRLRLFRRTASALRRRQRCLDRGEPRRDLRLARFDLRLAGDEAGNEVQHLRRNDVAKLLACRDFFSRPRREGKNLRIKRLRDDLALLDDQSARVHQHQGADEQGQTKSAPRRKSRSGPW